MEVCLNGEWGSVCNHRWFLTEESAFIICAQLGFEGNGESSIAKSWTYTRRGRTHVVDVQSTTYVDAVVYTIASCSYS